MVYLNCWRHIHGSGLKKHSYHSYKKCCTVVVLYSVRVEVIKRQCIRSQIRGWNGGAEVADTRVKDFYAAGFDALVKRCVSMFVVDMSRNKCSIQVRISNVLCFISICDPFTDSTSYLPHFKFPGGGSLESETIKCGHEFWGTRTWEWLHWRGPAVNVNDRPILS
jgi:hypothetical protein